MLKVTTKMWYTTPSDYKTHIGNQKFIMLTCAALQPCEIDDKDGVRDAVIRISKTCPYHDKLYHLGEEAFRVVYDPTKSKLDNLKAAGFRSDDLLITYYLENDILNEDDLEIEEENL